MIDRLNKLEKHHFLESGTKCKLLREIRNNLLQKCPSSYRALADTLNKAFENYTFLELTLEKIIYEYAIRTK